MKPHATDGPKNLPIRKLLFFFLKYFFGLFSCIYLFLAGFIFSRNRDLINRICAHFGLSRAVGGWPGTKKTIPEKRLSELLDYRVPVRITEVEAVTGNTGITELYILSFFARKLECSSIFEIGTFDGRTALNFAINSPPGAKVYTIDLPKNAPTAVALPVTPGDNVHIQRNVTGQRYRNKDREAFPEVGKIVQLFGDSATFDFSPFFGKIDMVFVDAAHSYEYVMNDSRIAMKLMKDGGGLIIWHDYDARHDGLTRALNELNEEHHEIEFFHIQGTTLVYAEL
jgi:predicted O-methyltransferase YrrM